jgi:hypothetical protein
MEGLGLMRDHIICAASILASLEAVLIVIIGAIFGAVATVLMQQYFECQNRRRRHLDDLVDAIREELEKASQLSDNIDSRGPKFLDESTRRLEQFIRYLERKHPDKHAAIKLEWDRLRAKPRDNFLPLESYLTESGERIGRDYIIQVLNDLLYAVLRL